MIHAIRIYITRAEGFSHECDVTHVCDSFAEADAVLRFMARTAPDGGGYDKCDFAVRYADGETYEGRYDLTYDDVVGASLARHMSDHVTFSAGVRLPEHLISRYGEFEAKKRRDAYLRDIVGDNLVAKYRKFLDTYAIGDAST